VGANITLFLNFKQTFLKIFFNFRQQIKLTAKNQSVKKAKK